jgi:competence protein ComEC
MFWRTLTNLGERYLMALPPHHGSKTSSSATFLAALHPAFALVSAGWRSRFGHPNPLTVKRYADAGIALSNTADGGALTIAVERDAPPRLVSKERERKRRYWRE